MRKILPIFLLFFSFAPGVYANYQTAKADYTFQYSKYRDALDSYSISKSTYLTYRTLTAQNDAIVKLRSVIQARDNVIATYYNLLQEKLNATPGVPNTYQQTFAEIKESEKKWLAEHQKKIDAAASLEDLNAAARDFEAHYSQFDRETKQVVGQVLLAKQINLKVEADLQSASFAAKLAQMRAAGENTTLLDRGMIFVQNKLDLSSQKSQTAQKIFTIPENINIYDGVQRLTEANQYLREALNYLSELIKSVTG